MQIERWWGDVRFAVRSVVARPGFSLLVVLTLALGFGAGSAVLALADAVLWRPLPYRDPGRLVFLWQTLRQQNVFELETTPAEFVAWQSHLKTLSTLAMADTDSVTLTGAGGAERVRAARVTASVFPLLGISPRAGRAFEPAEDTSAAAPVAILSDGLWRRRYGADAGIVGASIRINGLPHTVVGVMPPGAMLPGPLAASSDLWLAARLSPEEWANEISHNYTAIGRLADGVTLQGAGEEIAAFAASRAADRPNTHAGVGARVVSVSEDTVRQIRPTLLALIGGVALLILITCANVSTLMLVHATSRRHEIAVRAALGAGRARLLTLSILHAMLLAASGGAAGLVAGQWILKGILPTIAESLPPSAVTHIDARTALWSLALALAVGAAVGLVSGMTALSRRLADDLRSGSRTSAAPRVTRVRSVNVVAQIAFAVVLLGAAGLLVRSLTRLAHVSPGFVADRVLTLRLSLDGTGSGSPQQRSAFVATLLDRLNTAPGVERTAVISHVPLGGSRGANGFEIEGRPASRGDTRIADQRHITPDYFRAMGIRTVRGRVFDVHDDAAAEPVVIVNRTMATRFWPDGDPIDQRVRLSAGFDSGVWFRIVGVVDDVRHVSMSRPAVAEMYRPYAQAAVPDFTVVLKTRGEPAAAAPLARSAVQGLDRDLPVYDLRTMDERIARSFAQLRATMSLLAMTAALAAALAGVAIYGSIWYSVTQRLPEIGLRYALGASPASICARVVGRAFRLTAIGAAAGTAGAMIGASALRTFLFETTVADPMTYAAVTTAIVVLTGVAAVVPAARAMWVDPIVVLRNE